ncbi:MAG: cytochrome c556 [Candidatus Azotimanducaceae bacterium]|jgi:cytochrome c556
MLGKIKFRISGEDMKSIAITFMALLLSNAVLADAEKDIDYRKATMMVVGGHMKSMGTILKGRMHQSDLKVHADGMKSIATIVPSLFPEGSGDGKTEALSAVWENPAEFKMKMDEFVAAADGMAMAVDSGEMSAIGPAIQKLGGSCKGCHDDFKNAD